jgi:outer membrane protein OmpA-like peptidoglycan-associated protein
MKLIQKRAKTLIKFLSKKGIAEDRITAYAFESKLPFTLNKNAETKNYLIEIKIVPFPIRSPWIFHFYFRLKIV